MEKGLNEEDKWLCSSKEGVRQGGCLCVCLFAKERLCIIGATEKSSKITHI